jgi:hypothetical protein
MDGVVWPDDTEFVAEGVVVFDALSDFGFEFREIIRVDSLGYPFVGAIEFAGLIAPEFFDPEGPHDFISVDIPIEDTHMCGIEGEAEMFFTGTEFLGGFVAMGDILEGGGAEEDLTDVVLEGSDIGEDGEGGLVFSQVGGFVDVVTLGVCDCGVFGKFIEAGGCEKVGEVHVLDFVGFVTVHGGEGGVGFEEGMRAGFGNGHAPSGVEEDVPESEEVTAGGFACADIDADADQAVLSLESGKSPGEVVGDGFAVLGDEVGFEVGPACEEDTLDIVANARLFSGAKELEWVELGNFFV